MANETNKKQLKLSLELTNGDYHKITCSSIDIDKFGIDVFGSNCDISNLQFVDISLLSIYVEDDNSNEKIMLKLVKEPKENL